jgi:hypothetical protein
MDTNETKTASRSFIAKLKDSFEKDPAPFVVGAIYVAFVIGAIIGTVGAKREAKAQAQAESCLRDFIMETVQQNRSC